MADRTCPIMLSILDQRSRTYGTRPIIISAGGPITEGLSDLPDKGFGYRTFLLNKIFVKHDLHVACLISCVMWPHTSPALIDSLTRADGVGPHGSLPHQQSPNNFLIWIFTIAPSYSDG